MSKGRRTKNPIAAALRTPVFKKRIVKSKKDYDRRELKRDMNKSY